MAAIPIQQTQAIGERPAYVVPAVRQPKANGTVLMWQGSSRLQATTVWALQVSIGIPRLSRRALLGSAEESFPTLRMRCAGRRVFLSPVCQPIRILHASST